MHKTRKRALLRDPSETSYKVKWRYDRQINPTVQLHTGYILLVSKLAWLRVKVEDNKVVIVDTIMKRNVAWRGCFRL